jgi:cation:H+ antiporter
MDYLLIVLGFIILILGANYFVDGAVSLAKKFNIPDLIIGLTIVAFGTSSPELVINVIAALNPDTTDIALTNIIGSNNINTLVILGLTALVYPIKSQKQSRVFDIPFSLLAPIVILFLAWETDSSVSRIDGIILLCVFTVFMYITVKNSVKSSHKTEEIQAKPVKLWLSAVLILGGLAALIGGGELIVPRAVRIAESLGIDQSIIGLTVVALGTSLPELATSIVAAFKKNSDIALGNVIGSNIFNVFFVLGISGLIRPLPAYDTMLADLVVCTLGSLLILVIVFANKKNHEIKRWNGALLVMIYAVYIIAVITGKI